ncbi:MAG: hypothetical protein JWQ18_1742, partial [Conexibacter sp.]|nr:hypothetical protein [Conexibacter sp.]
MGLSATLFDVLDMLYRSAQHATSDGPQRLGREVG